MEENLSENYEVLLNDINKILVKSNKINNEKERFDFLKQNEAIFVMFKNNINEIANQYLIKESGNIKQNKVSCVLKNIIIQVLNNEKNCEEHQFLEDYTIMIVNMLCHYENRLIFRLRHSKEIKLISECLNYQRDREAYIRAIKNNKMIENNIIIQKAVKNYMNYSYEKTIFENLIRIIKDDQVVITEEKSKALIKQIDCLEFIDSILRKEEEKLQVTERRMLQKYADTIIPFKVNTYPETLEKDRLVVAFLNGKIKNDKLYMQIANAIPINEFESLIFAINMKNKTRIIKDVKLGNLSNEEKQEIDRLLEKAGIEINKKKEEPEDDENYLVTIEELKEYYQNAKIEDIYNAKARFYKANINEEEGKKELSSSDKKAYKEISVIISMMTKKIRDKISPRFIEFIERNKRGKIDIDKNKKLQGQKLRDETKILLAIIYRDYICSEEEKKKIIKEESKIMGEQESEQQERSLILIEELKWYQRVKVLVKKAINRRKYM